jgi:hypothetical protein
MSKPGLDGRHRNKDGEISGKHGNTLVRTLRKVYGQGFAAGYPETAKLSEVMLQLNETSLSQLRRDYETDHLEHKMLRHRNEGASLSISLRWNDPSGRKPSMDAKGRRVPLKAWQRSATALPG